MAFPNQQVPNQMLAKTPQGLGSLNPTAPQQNAYQVTPEMGKQTNMPGGFGGQGGFNQPQIQKPQGGFAQQLQSLGQPQPQNFAYQQLADGTPAYQQPLDTSEQAYRTAMASTSFAPGSAGPTYDQWVQQRTQNFQKPLMSPEQMQAANNQKLQAFESLGQPAQNTATFDGKGGVTGSYTPQPQVMPAQIQQLLGGPQRGFPPQGMPQRGFPQRGNMMSAMLGMGGLRGGMMPAMGGMGGGMKPAMGGMGGLGSLGGGMGGMGGGLNAIPPALMQAQQATPQGLGGLAAYGPQAFKAGGSVEMRDIAQKLQDKGRNGDTMLAHINPQEAGILSALGGSGTINPHTGLPEYWNPVKAITRPIKKVLSKADDVIFQPITGAIQDVVQGVAKATGPVGQIVASAYGGPLGAALYAGLAGEDGFNFKRGLMAGAMTWGAQNLAEGLGGTESAAGSVPTPGPEAVGLEGLNATASEIAQTGLTTPPTPTVMGQLGSGDFSGAMNTAGQNISNAASNMYNSAASGVTNAFNDPASLIPKNALANQDLGTVMSNAGKVLGGDTSAFTGKLTSSVLPMYMGATGMKAVDEMEKFKKEQEELEAKQAADKARYMDLGLTELKKNPFMYAEGGNVSDDAGIAGRADGLTPMGSPLNYAAGGAPRFLSGGGDGMSDSIPATIDGKQPARIADGEFIIPADVVSHLGNGSSKAGAKQLYSMMDKVRAARTGTKKQGKQINPNKYLPA